MHYRLSTQLGPTRLLANLEAVRVEPMQQGFKLARRVGHSCVLSLRSSMKQASELFRQDGWQTVAAEPSYATGFRVS